MTNLTNYSYPAYESNKAAAGVLATLIGISLIAWIVQSIQARFTPRRIIILLLIAHLTIFTELLLRAGLSTNTRNSRASFTATTVLLAIGQRTIILANYDFLIRVGHPKSCTSRAILIGTLLGAIGSAVLMGLAGALSYSTDTIDQSFHLRQASTAIVLCMTALFYPIWFATKTAKNMTKQAISLIIISSLTCVVVALFLLITSVRDYYIATNQQELWFYIFQLTPIAIALFVWTIFHPKRILVSTVQRQEDMKEDIGTDL
jgi:cytochrome bd-type quinol oxidase subunit 2